MKPPDSKTKEAMRTYTEQRREAVYNGFTKLPNLDMNVKTFIDSPPAR
jgi:hypothetical protein